MDGPPLDHVRKCECKTCAAPKKDRKCECVELNGDKLQCKFCKLRLEHLVCRCEVCGWWEALTGTDRRLRFDTRRYLTDRRDGKPAQGVFLGDTREGAQALTRGNDAPSYFGSAAHAPRNPAGANKPN